MKYLVTGGAGFIGSHVVDALVGREQEVTVVDNLSTGFEENINPLAQFYRVDICDQELGNIFKLEKPDVVIHLAAQTSVTRSIASPAFDAKVNIIGSMNVISNCVDHGVRKIVYASSSALYGPPAYLPLNETHQINPISHYGVSKHTVEHYLALHRYLHGLAYVALRYANVYGPRQNPRGEGGVVAIFAGKMLAGERPTIFGAGDKTRDYVYVGDVVRANLSAVDSAETGIFNIGTGCETDDQTVFDQISRQCDFRDTPLYAHERPGEIKRMCLDCRKAQEQLQWQPHVRLDEGVATAVSYYRTNLTKLRV